MPVASCAQHLSPTAIALGSSAIVKVSGQNCFRTLCGSLGQICVEPPRGSLEGSTKVAQVSWCLWPSATDPSWAAKRFCGTKVPPRFQQGCAKVPPRFFKFRGVSGSLGPKGSVLKGSLEGSPRIHQGFTSTKVSATSGADPSWGAKRFCARFPPSLL